HLRTDAWLTRRNRAASAVFNSLSLIVTLVSRTESIAEIGVFCASHYGSSRACYQPDPALAGRTCGAPTTQGLSTRRQHASFRSCGHGAQDHAARAHPAHPGTGARAPRSAFRTKRE